MRARGNTNFELVRSMRADCAQKGSEKGEG